MEVTKWIVDSENDSESSLPLRVAPGVSDSLSQRPSRPPPSDLSPRMPFTGFCPEQRSNRSGDGDKMPGASRQAMCY
jgi:hypothetical protein